VRTRSFTGPAHLLSRFAGVGGGGLAPVEQAILVDTFHSPKAACGLCSLQHGHRDCPRDRPAARGWITDNWSWRWIFFINIPIGILSLILTNRLVSDPPSSRVKSNLPGKAQARIDGLGIVLVALGFACLEVVLDRGQPKTGSKAASLSCSFRSRSWH